MWTDSTYLDVVTTTAVAQMVVERLLHEELDFDAITNPFVMKIKPDVALVRFGALIMHRDLVARLDAFSTIDFSGQWPATARSAVAWKHESFEILDRCKHIDINAELAALAAGRQATTPDSGRGTFIVNGTEMIPRGTSGAILPQMERVPTYSYSPAVSQASAALLNAARATRQAASVANDAGLAATAAATWTAARAAYLAAAQAAYPARGYV